MNLDLPETKEEINLSLYKLYGSSPSSENLVAFSTMMLLMRLNEKMNKLLEILTEGAVETFTRE